MKRLFGVIALGSLIKAVLATMIVGPGQIGTKYCFGNGSYSALPGQGYQVNLNDQTSSFGINLPPGTDWSGDTHVILQLQNTGVLPVMLFVGIDSGSGANGGWMYSDTQIPAGQSINLAMPLHAHVAGQTLWSPPSLADPTLVQTITEGTLVPNNVVRLRLANLDPQGPMSIQVHQINTASPQQVLTQFVDQYGQQVVEFPGRVTSDAQLQAQAAADAQLSGNYPFNNDAYGGVANTATTSPTGRWSVAKQNGRWFILDPLGNRFFSTGIVCAGWNNYSFTQDRLSYFQPGALPSQTGPFSAHYAFFTDGPGGSSALGFNFYSSNLQRKFGANWWPLAQQNIARRMRTWGFNTVGGLTSLENPELIATAPVLTAAGSYARITTLDGFPMPDVYDPAWAVAVQAALTTKLPLLTGNNMGFFLDNELPWAQGPTTPDAKYLLPFSVLSAGPTQPAKVRFVNSLTMQYRTIQRLNAVWGTNFVSWAAMLNNRSFHPSVVNAGMDKDLMQYVSQFATAYFSTVRSSLKRVPYNGLYLGCRILYYTPEVLAAAKRYADVVSFNAYELRPDRYRPDLKALDAPVLISEFGFGASDLGRMGGYSPNIATEGDRVTTYQGYVNEAATWTNLVGAHYYQWEDDPPAGRVWDSVNFGIGLVSITDNPYPLMIAAAKQANMNFQNALLNP